MVENGKKLNELRVSDLKEELEKRKMDTIGAKATLVERLEKALKQEGLDPTKYVFKTNSKSVLKAEEPTVKNELMEVKVKEEPLDDEYVENGQNEEHQHDEDDDEIDQVGTVDDECVVIEDEEQYDDENADNEHDEEVENAAANNVEDDEDNVETNNHYGDESLNLTIGEDEQLLLHEAADEKEKPAEVNTSQKDKSSNKEHKSEKTHKDDKKSTKDEDAIKSRKKDDKTTSDKKDNSEHKSTTKSTQKDDKEKSNNVSTNNAVSNSTKTSKTSTPSRNLWVSGLSSLTRASDLKTIFSTYGKVIGAKVVTNTRTPGSRCYGYVTMSSSSDASRCIDHLHRTELHGRIISVERTKNEIGSNSANANKDSAKSHSSRADSKKKDDDKKSGSSKETSAKGNDDKRRRDDAKKDDKDKDKDKGKDKKDDKDSKHDRAVDRKRSREPVRSKDYDKEFRQREKEHLREIKRHREILSYHKIREERERQRLRQKERELREEERRRRELRDRHRQEELRLAEERRKLLQERDRLEKERSELMRLERERQKLEREKIELERLEVKRQQMKMLQAREDPIKRHSKHATDDRYADVPERKRTTATESRLEAPPPPRFDPSLVSSRSYDKKRDDYTSTSTSKRIDYNKRDEYPSTGSKRSAIDDYTSVPVKRASDEYTKRGDYLPSTKPAREEYKREVEIRHIPSGGTSNAFHSKSSSNRYGGDAERTNYRRTGGIDDIRSSSNNVWSATGHIGGGTSLSTSLHNSSWQKNMHTDDNTWRPAQAAQDRYDRTFNERGGYGGSGAMYGNSGRTGQDRYGPMSRY